MIDNESISGQAKALSELFVEAAEVVTQYKQTKSPADSVKFNEILTQLDIGWKKLEDSYNRLDDKKVKESFEKAGDMRNDKQTVLRNMVRTIPRAISSLRVHRDNIEKGIDEQGRARHMATTANQMAQIIKDDLIYFFRD